MKVIFSGGRGISRQFLGNLSKIIPSQKTADISLQMLTLVVFLLQGKEMQKLTKIVQIEEVKVHIF